MQGLTPLAGFKASHRGSQSHLCFRIFGELSELSIKEQVEIDQVEGLYFRQGPLAVAQNSRGEIEYREQCGMFRV